LDRKPPWLKKKISLNNSNISIVKNLIESGHLHTVCQSAKCPNIFECFSRKTATFMLMGDICTRNCAFCGIESGRPGPLDRSEPDKIARAVREMGLRYAVITSVTRDDLADGGASHFYDTVRRIKELNPGVRVECLIPDFRGDKESLEKVISSGLDVLNHNIETIEDNYSFVRKGAEYNRSLKVLDATKNIKAGMMTKSGFMVGLGENMDQIVKIMEDLIKNRVDILTVGQYLQPSPENIRVSKYYRPEEFDRIKETALDMGFLSVESGPFVRSSYRAEDVLDRALMQIQTNL
jgi:lipoyl synthase